MSANILAVDQGTSGTTALVVCPERGVIGTGYAQVRPRYAAGGSVEQDPGHLLDSVLAAGREAMAAAGEPVAALGLANQGETVLAWDPATGDPLTDAIVWQDRRAQSVCDDLAPVADRLTELVGLPLDPYFAAPKMAWLRRNRTREGVVTTSDAWLVHQLTGRFVTDASTASRTMLLDLDAVAWSASACELFGLGGELLPEVVDASGSFGHTSAFGRSIPLTGLLVDQQAALLAQGCLDEGSTKCTYGTGAFMLANTGTNPRRSHSGLVPSVAWRLAGRSTYCLDGQVLTVGSAVRWLTDLGVVGASTDLDRVGGAVDDAGGVRLVPAFAGLAAPHWRSEVRAAVTGLTLGTTAGHLVRALCDGICAQVAALVGAVAADLDHPLDRLRVDGGLTRSHLLMQTQADLLQLPVEVYETSDATAIGVAAAARMGLEPGLRPQDAIPHWEPARVYEPVMTPDEAGELLAEYDRILCGLMAGAPS